MKHLIIILFIIFFKFNLSVIAQCINGGCGVQLIPNPGFEIAGTPTISGSIVMPLTPGPLPSWFGTDNSGASTPDYHNLHGVVPAPNSANANNYACTSGNGMVGFFTRAAGSGHGREYVEAQLISPLVAGQQYCFSMVVKSRQTASPPAPPNNVLTQCDGVGVWFHNQGLIDINTMNGGAQFIGAGSIINAIPQIDNAAGNLIAGSCQTITGTFCAQGGESYIVIGNFRDNTNTIMVGAGTSNYMYLDDVSLKASCNTPLTSSIAASPTLICQGSCSTLSASISGGSSPFTYTWQPGGQTTPTINACPITTTTYTLFTGSAGACILPQTYSTTITLSVMPNASVSVNSATICAGGIATLTATGATSYTWSSGLSSTTGSIVTATPGATTIYTVTSGVGTCTSSTTSSVTVASVLSITVPSVGICSGSTATLSANGASTYTWLPMNVTGTTTTVSPTTNTTYTVNGSSGACTGSTAVNVNVTTIPTISVNNATICASTSTVLTASGATSYTWSNGVTTNTTLVSPTINPTSFTVTGSTNGCTNTAVSTISVIPSPIITVNSSTICSGGTATLTATGATSYTWSSGLSSTTGSIVTGNPSSTNVYTVTGSAGACTSTITSTINVIPPVTITSNSASICIGNSATLIVSGATTYTWLPMNVTGNTIAVSPIINTTYTVNGTNGTCTGSTVVNVNVISIPTISVNNATVCAGTASILTVIGATNYTWSNGATSNTISVAPNTSSTYSVIGSVNTCTSSITSTVFVNPAPTITISSDITIVKGESTTLNVVGTGITYSWTPTNALSCTACLSPIASPAVTTQYCINTFIGSCTTASCVIVTVEPACYSNADYGAPNAFTPNGDGINDEFCLKGWNECTTSFYIAIYNRWGEKVYDSNDAAFCWDGNFIGSPLNSAVFTFYIKAEILKVGTITKHGNITLIK